jgi:predicted transcriptional regulator
MSSIFSIDKHFFLGSNLGMDEREQIRAWLSLRKLKPYQLAKKAGVSFPVVYRFLKGERDIRLSTLEKLKAVMK